MYLNNDITDFLHSEYIDCIGYAHIENYEKELIEQGGSIVKGYKYGISIGISLPGSIVDFLPDKSDPNIACQYKSHCYDIINQRLNLIASKLSSLLNQKGYRSLPVTTAERTNDTEAAPTVSHKTIAHIAGLGWIGKSCLLITPEHGPRIRFTTVLTNAPISAVNAPVEQRCGSCMECVKICPVKAIKGVNFEMGTFREERFDFRKCQEYFEEMSKESKWAVCGMCLYVCPYGKK